VHTATRDGAQVRLEGTGRYNGRAGHRFVIDAVDGGGKAAGRLRVRISHRDAAGAEVLDYDSAGLARNRAGIAAAAAAAEGLAPVDGVLALTD
jgi:hypothetical protein